MDEWFVQLTMAVCGACGIAQPPNSCNANRYASGLDSVGWHADDEDLFDGTRRDALVLSLSLGAPRTFRLRRIGEVGRVVETLLGDGDLCTMEGLCQKYYQHGVPKEPELGGVRINLTWRWIVMHGPDCPLGVPEGPLREKLRSLAEAKQKLAALKRRREEKKTPEIGAVEDKLVRLAEARQRLAELQQKRHRQATAAASG